MYTTEHAHNFFVFEILCMKWRHEYVQEDKTLNSGDNKLDAINDTILPSTKFDNSVFWK